MSDATSHEHRASRNQEAVARRFERGVAVDAMLAVAGLTVAPDDRASLLELHALHHPGVAALHALPAARYEALAPAFRAEPSREGWGDS